MALAERLSGRPAIPASSELSGSPVAGTLAAVVIGLAAAATWREGAFWRTDALTVAIVAGIVTGAILCTRPPRRSTAIIVVGVVLAGWWAARAAATRDGWQALPFAASVLGFVAAAATVGCLEEVGREAVAVAVSVLGAAFAALGLVGVVLRRYPLAMPAQRLWRLAGTLTYANAAGIFLAIALLVSVGLGPRRWYVRLAACLCLAGLLASQSRGAGLGLICALPLVPWRQLRRGWIPLAAGAAGGVAIVATSPDTGRPWPVLAVLLAAALTSVLPLADRHGSGERPFHLVAWRQRPGVLVVALLIMLVGGVASLAALWVPLGRRVGWTSTGERLQEWSAASAQFKMAPMFGVGPDRLLSITGGGIAHFAHDEYLQVAAGSGVVGVVLLGSLIAATAAACRRRDDLSSCACGALVALLAAGAVDFDWHLPAIALLAGVAAGVAHRPPSATAGPTAGGPSQTLAVTGGEELSNVGGRSVQKPAAGEPAPRRAGPAMARRPRPAALGGADGAARRCRSRVRPG